MTHYLKRDGRGLLSNNCGSDDGQSTNQIAGVDCPECLIRIAESTCPKCGHLIHVGEWYQCPHEPYKGAAISDSIPGGATYENYGPHPVTFYSKSEQESYMRANGLTRRERFAPMPGTDIDPAGIPNPKGYMDPQTLENARILLSRVKGQPAEEEPAVAIRNSFVLVDGGKDAQALVDGDARRASRLGRRMQDGGKRTVDAGR